MAANNTLIATYGTSELTLSIGLPQTYKWNFIIADVSTPIIGADFLATFGLLPDLQRRRLIDNKTLLSVPCEQINSSQFSVHLVTQLPCVNEKIKELLNKYAQLLKPPQYCTDPPHEIQHFIETPGAPESEKPRRLRPQIARKVKEEFHKLEKIGIVQQSNSPWSAPIIAQQKKRPNAYHWRLPKIKFKNFT